MPNNTLELLKHLISRPSITPHDNGCQEIIAQRLSKLGFQLEPMRFGLVDNLWAKHGSQTPLIVFAGHTDVVPPGPLNAWHSDPFSPQERDGFIYGRGASDMKSGLAAMITAAENFINQYPNYQGSIGFLVTSDEEGAAVDGTQKVIEVLEKRNEKIDYCIVGEASSEKLIGDQIRIGRRGSLSAKLTVYGKQGHVAFPHLVLNPIHAAAPAIRDLTAETWDQGNEFFPPTSFQISNIHAGTGAANVVPGVLQILFNFRFSTALTTEQIQNRVLKILEKYSLTFDIEWEASNPFLTKKGKLLNEVQSAIKELTGLDTHLSTGGGTSDGRFIAPTGAEVIELGPVNETIHQINERTNIKELEILAAINKRILEKMLLK